MEHSKSQSKTLQDVFMTLLKELHVLWVHEKNDMNENTKNIV